MKSKTLRMSRAECARSLWKNLTGNLKGQKTYFNNRSSKNIAAFLNIKQFVLFFFLVYLYCLNFVIFEFF